jgi:hypothetical protein
MKQVFVVVGIGVSIIFSFSGSFISVFLSSSLSFRIEELGELNTENEC